MAFYVAASRALYPNNKAKNDERTYRRYHQAIGREIADSDSFEDFEVEQRTRTQQLANESNSQNHPRIAKATAQAIEE
jgi:hypothetical protein